MTHHSESLFPTDYTSLGETQSGRAFVEKYLHPPGPPLEGINGITDRQSACSVNPEFRDDFTLEKPRATAPSADSTWCCLFFVMNNVLTPFATFSWWNGGGAFASEDDREVHLSTSGGLKSKGLASQIRGVGRSLTIELDSTDLTNSGTVYAAQASTSVQRVLSRTFADASGRCLKYEVKGSLSTDVHNSIPQLSPSFYKGRARDGVFMPMKYVSPALQYGEVDSILDLPQMQISKYETDQFGTLNAVTYQAIYKGIQGAEHVVLRGISEAPPAVQDIFYNPFPADNFGTGWILFTGLDPKATLKVKTVQMMEAIVPIDSPWTPFSQPPALVDQYAVDKAYQIRGQMADAYPACYNSFGSFIAGAKRLAPRLLELAQSGPGKSLIGMLPGGGTINTVLENLPHPKQTKQVPQSSLTSASTKKKKKVVSSKVGTSQKGRKV